MKAQFVFCLPEEQEEFEIFQNASKTNVAVSNFLNWLRSEIKYSQSRTEEEINILRDVRIKFFEFIDEQGLPDIY